MKRKSLISIILIIVIVISNLTIVYADDGGKTGKRGNETGTSEDFTISDIIDDADLFLDRGGNPDNQKLDTDDLSNISSTIYNILLVLGIVAAIIVGLIMGIKYILGSIEEKAEIKGMLIPYIIGCVVVFGAFTIWQIIVDLLQSM